MSTLTPYPADHGYELRFENLFAVGRGYAFPCDARGQVDLNGLSERQRNAYLYARAVMGRQTSSPTVRRTT
jgi:hypothetical protein